MKNYEIGDWYEKDACEVCKYFVAENEDFGVCDVLNDLIVDCANRTCEYFKFDSDEEEEKQ